MKKKFALLPMLFLLLPLSACGGNSPSDKKPTENSPGETHNHSYSEEWSYDEFSHWHAATCEHKNEIKDKAAHTFSNWIESKPASEDEEGSRYRECTVCKYRETESIDKLAHTHVAGEPVKENVVDPTCTEKGSYDLVAYCSKDHYEMSREHIIVDELGHDYQPVETPATYDAAGYITYTCSRCHDSYVEEGQPQLVHHYSEQWSYDDEHNTHYHACIDEGYTHLRSDEAEHTYNWVTDVEATATQKGHKTGTCVCGKQVEEVIQATGSVDKLEFDKLHNFDTNEDYWSVRAKSSDIEGEVVIPEYYDGLKVSHLSSSGFSECKNITSVIIPSTITVISDYAFSQCENLLSISLPDTITRIETFAFYKCTSLKEVNIPDKVTYIGTDAFALTAITSINIPDSVTEMGQYVFASCYYLQSVTIGKGIKEIIRYTFYEAGLKSIVIPDNIVTINECAFEKCINLTSVDLGNGVKKIGNYAFYSCSSLTSITLPESLETIDSNAFVDCTILVEVINKSTLNIEKGSNNYGYVAYYAINVLSEKIDSTIKEDDDGFVVYDDKEAATLLKYNGEASEITIPFKVRKIHAGAFKDCKTLTSVVVSDGVTYIGQNAFEGCDNLKTITLPFIGDGGEENTKFEYIGCANVENVILSDICQIIPADSFKNNKTLKSITIGKGVTTIGHNAFYGCSGLTEVTVPSNVLTIEYGAFYECTSLVSLRLSTAITKVSNSLCWGCSSLRSIVIPASVQTVQYGAFYDCTSLLSVTIGSGVNMIQDDAFKNDTHLVQVINKSNIKITKGNSNNGQVAYWAIKVDTTDFDLNIQENDGFLTCVCDGHRYLIDYVGEDNEIVIPNSISIIHYKSFNARKDLSSITMGEEITTIDRGAYEDCEELTTFVVGKNVKEINDSAFAYCNNLTSLTISKSVKYIGDYFICRCPLTEIDYTGTTEEWEAIEKGEDWTYKWNVIVIHCTNGDINIE